MPVFWPVFVLLLFLYTYYRWGYLPFQVFKMINIPGPPPLPFLGNALPFIFRKDGMDVIAKWNQKYGAVCGYFCGTWPAISTIDPQFIQTIFITKFRQFPDRCAMSLVNSRATGLPLGIFEYNNMGVDSWKKLRNIALPAFTKAKLLMMSHYLEKSCLVMLDRMLEESSANQKIDVMRIYRDCALESAILAVLGQEVQLQKGEAHEFKSWMELGTRVAHGKHPFSQSLPVDVFIGHHFPWFVKFYYWLGLGSYLPAFRKLKTVITDCIKERRQKARANKLQDNCVLNLLVAASESEDSDSVLSDEDLISNCLNFLFAAYDTTSLTLTCASHLLATNTHVQDKLCDMLDDYWSQNKDASVSDVAQEIPYLDMILDETMRLYPPAPRQARVCRETTEVCGITIPKDMNIIVPLHYLHRIESIWGDPDIFRPERFDKEESASRPSCCYLPMGLGPRNCIGLKLAKFLMKIVLVTVLKHHHFTSTHSTGVDLETECYISNLTLKSTVLVDIQRRT